MKKRFLKRLFLGTGIVCLLLGTVLAIHIYMVTRRTPPDAGTLAMARIDFDQQLNQADADKISNWLYQQEGVDHVLCNPSGKLVVFTYHPLNANPDRIAGRMKADLPYASHRFLPNKEDMQDGCPVAKTSLTYKLYRIFQ